MRTADCEWDPAKARTNFAKHGIHFADAVSALEDVQALTIGDSSTADEDRWITLGMDALGRILVVVYTLARRTAAAYFRPPGDSTREAAI